MAAYNDCFINNTDITDGDANDIISIVLNYLF